MKFFTIFFTITILLISSFANASEYDVSFSVIRFSRTERFSYKDSKSEFISHPFTTGTCAKTHVWKSNDGEYNLMVACSDDNAASFAMASCSPHTIGDNDTQSITNESKTIGFIVNCYTSRKITIDNQWSEDKQTNYSIKQLVKLFIDSVFEKLNSSRTTISM